MDITKLTKRLDAAKTAAEALYERFQKGTQEEKLAVYRELAHASVPVAVNFSYLLTRIHTYISISHQEVLVGVIEASEQPSTNDTLHQRRLDVAERWFQNSDLNGDQVVEANGWESGDSPDELKRTLFVETDTGEGDSIKKVLRVQFCEKSVMILAAYLPTSTRPQDDNPGLEVDGSAYWNRCPHCANGIDDFLPYDVRQAYPTTCPHCGSDLAK